MRQPTGWLFGDDFPLERGDELAVDDGEARVTYAELAERAARVAGLLRSRGIGVDDHVALIAKNRLEHFEVFLGTLAVGAWLTPLAVHLGDEERRAILEDAGVRVVFVDPDVVGSGEAWEGVEVISLGEAYERALALASPEPPSHTTRAGGAMMYTSGTSGRPKGVKRAPAPTLTDALTTMRTTGDMLGLDGFGTHLVTGPLYHAAPFLFALYDLLNGARVLVLRRFDAERVLEIMSEERVSHVHFVPTMFVRLLALPERVKGRFDASSLTTVLHGAAPITPEVKRAMITWWGPRLREYWGATEGGLYTLVDSEAWLSRPGTVGRPISAYEVNAFGAEGEPLPPGEVGVLACRHRRLERPFVYHRDPEKTAAAYREGGYFTVGDLGYVDEEGYVFLSDRRSNLILCGGVNLYPAQIERVLTSHPDVEDAAVFGVADAEWGEVVHAIVVPRPASKVRESELGEWVKERLGGLARPRHVEFVDAVPRLPTGKIARAALRGASGR